MFINKYLLYLQPEICLFLVHLGPLGKAIVEVFFSIVHAHNLSTPSAEMCTLPSRDSSQLRPQGRPGHGDAGYADVQTGPPQGAVDHAGGRGGLTRLPSESIYDIFQSCINVCHSVTKIRLLVLTSPCFIEADWSSNDQGIF